MVKRGKHEVLVYAEGGGDSDELKSQMRQAFSEFFDKTHLKTCKPRVIACGSRSNAFNDFRIAIGQGRNALLLVDSETALDADRSQDNHFSPWMHLKNRDNWDKPDKAGDEDCHLMVQVMESWFLAEWETVAAFFGQGFKVSTKPIHPIEKVDKDSVYGTLDKATRDCKSKSKYGKGAHSFRLLALISPNSVLDASPWAKRFIDEIAKRKRKD